MIFRSSLCQFVLGGAALLTLGCSSSRVDELAAELRDGNVQARRAAALSLKELSSEKSNAIPSLVNAANGDDDMEVRRLSLQALATMGPRAQECLPRLTPLLEDSEESVRIATALAIARIDPDSESCRPVLIRAMRAGNGGILLAVGKLGADAKWAVPALVELLSHDLVQLRSLAAHTLGQIGPAAGDAVPALERMSHNRDPAVREVALEALEHLRSAQTNAE
jgi:HEAT repeat protein